MLSNQPISAEFAGELLSALAEQLAASGEEWEIVVIGGAALAVLGLVARTTIDVDVVGVERGGAIVPADPMPEPLVAARDRVARDFGLETAWLNAQAADIVRLGLPEGFMKRAVLRRYPPRLTVRFASRLDLIHFKFHAFVDRGPGGKHEADLRALNPSDVELVMAARWAMTHDPSPGFRRMVVEALRYLGVRDADALDA